MKKVYVLLISFFAFTSFCCASSVNKISMDIYIDENGDALVKEVWDATATSPSTEIYKTYENIPASQIENFKVSLNDKVFTNITSWLVNAPFDYKAYKNGINTTSYGIELCWGASTYGHNKYILEYTIKDFIVSLNDSQMLYWTLIPRNITGGVSDVYIKVHSFYKFSDTLDVWGYGILNAPTYVSNGIIEMTTLNGLSSSEYMVLLAKFPSNTFKTTKTINASFDYYLKMAEEDSAKSTYSSTKSSYSRIDSFTLYIILFPILFTFILFASLFSKITKYKLTPKIKATLPKDVPYFRDIPCNGDIFKSFYISNTYGLCYKKENFFGAVLLKWLKNGYISVKTIERKRLFRNIDFVSAIEIGNVIVDNKLEEELLNMLRSASKNNTLSQGDFEKYCNINYNKVLNWFDKVLNNQMDTLVSSGDIIKNVEGKFIFKKVSYVQNTSIENDAIKLAGLKKYLEYFSNMKDKEVLEVHLWKDYLIYAQIFGIAKTVAEQFKKMYPELLREYGEYALSDFDTLVFVDSFTRSSMHKATDAKARAVERARDYSSGGGGFSSGGGGGGSFGGGSHGGGGFR